MWSLTSNEKHSSFVCESQDFVKVGYLSLVQNSSVATCQLCLNLLIDLTSLSLSFLKE